MRASMIIEELLKMRHDVGLEAKDPPQQWPQREVIGGKGPPTAVAAEGDHLVRYSSAATPAYLLVHFVDAIAGRRIESTRRCFVDLRKKEVLRFARILRQLSFEPFQKFSHCNADI